MFGFFSLSVPGTLTCDDDYATLAKIFAEGSKRKIIKALGLVEAAGATAQRAVPLVLPFLDQPEFSLCAARALWAVDRSPKAASVIDHAVASAKEIDLSKDPMAVFVDVLSFADTVSALSKVATADQSHLDTLLKGTKKLIDLLAVIRGSGGMFDKIVNEFTRGDDNTCARNTAAVLADIAWDHELVKGQLAAVVCTPKNGQQRTYVTLALAFAAFADRKQMKKAIGLLNDLFDSPSLALIPARNKLCDDMLAAGMVLAESFNKK